jgi:hypothetical protein
MQNFRSELAEYLLRTETAAPSFGRPPAENRKLAEEQLRKWAIQAMRLTPFNFNAVRQVGDFQEIDPFLGDLQAGVARLFEEAFEWEQGSYFLYPHYWGRRATWQMRLALTSVDPQFADFLRAGSARHIVPVTPGYEDRVLHYLESDPSIDEVLRLDGPPDDAVPPDSEFEDLWLELLIDRAEDLTIGSGTLSVQAGQATLTINPDSTWEAGPRDIGREIYVDGERYAIISVSAPDTIELDEAYNGVTDPEVRYASGSVPYGPPWVVRVPTSLVILSDRVGDLAPLGR